MILVIHEFSDPDRKIDRLPIAIKYRYGSYSNSNSLTNRSQESRISSIMGVWGGMGAGVVGMDAGSVTI
jgi:hypothetical protein